MAGGEEDVRRLIGLTPDEQQAMLAAMGRRIASVEHDISDDGEALMIIFEGGDALAVEAKSQLDLTHLGPLAVAALRMQWSNPAPADGLPTFTVERHGGTYEMRYEPLTGWRRLLGPWYRLRAWLGI